MANSREAIYAAVWALTAPLAPTAQGGNNTFLTYSRRLIMFDQVQSDSMPALFQVQTGEVPHKETGKPPLLCIKMDWVLYTSTGADTDMIPSSVFNPIIDTLEGLLIPNPGLGRNTLGGLVYDARWTGEIATSEGILGTTAINIMGLQVFVPEGFK